MDKMTYVFRAQELSSMRAVLGEPVELEEGLNNSRRKKDVYRNSYASPCGTS